MPTVKNIGSSLAIGQLTLCKLKYPRMMKKEKEIDTNWDDLPF